MPKVIGYGEDALTYWALTTRLDEILKILNNKFKVNVHKKDVSAILYRPSLGRGQHCHGEFDAIIIAKQKHLIFLIESKWHGSKEVKKEAKTIQLRNEQLERHNALRNFIKKISNPPKNDSILYENVSKILKLTGRGINIRVENVIILFWRDQDNPKRFKRGEDINSWKNRDWTESETDFSVVEIEAMKDDFFIMTDDKK